MEKVLKGSTAVFIGKNERIAKHGKPCVVAEDTYLESINIPYLPVIFEGEEEIIAVFPSELKWENKFLERKKT